MMSVRSVAACLAAVAVSGTACARGPRGSAPSPRSAAPTVDQPAGADTSEQARMGRFLQVYGQRSAPLQAAGNYLGEIALLRALGDSLGPGPTIRGIVLQQVATYLSFLGRPHEAQLAFDSLLGGGGDTATGAALDRLQLEDAVAAIAGVAETTQVVMINEAHHVPQTRTLTLALLRPLRERGYAYLAAETFGDTDSTLGTRGYAVRGTGFYSNEPLFGAVIREALRLGYTLVPYEAAGRGGQEARERGQAENLRDRILRDHPGAKVLVHAGYSHINEAGQLAGTAPMAVRFRELTGIDPFTIDQATMRERADTVHERAAYRRLVARHAVTRPSVLRDAATGRLWSARPGTHDVTVVLPRTVWDGGRPDWFRASGRRAVALPADVCRAAASCVVSARRAGEAEDAVPDDRLLVERWHAALLLLPPGRFVITAHDAGGRELSRDSVTVNGGS